MKISQIIERTKGHTPGEWRVDEHNTHPWLIRCPTRGFEDQPELDGNVGTVGYRPNAALISLAPEMLAKLARLDIPDEALVEVVKKAIATCEVDLAVDGFEPVARVALAAIKGALEG